MDQDYISISSLNQYIKGILDRETFLNRVYIKGEVSNFKNHTKGHLYFTLKDNESRINAVMFMKDAATLDFIPEDGMNVLVCGRVSAYPVQGSYQIYIYSMTPDGVGNLYIEYEKLKKKLAGEGLFNSEHKKQIPKYPSVIGVVTASTGAAVKDIMSTIKRRFPSVTVILFPSLVQGTSAKEDLVKQIKKADNYGLDTLIIGRGGGSIEDLWAFNEECVARAIYDCKTPVISAVGHEIDYTIADYVADLRAPTPTGAAEMAVPTVIDTRNMLNQYKIRLNKNIKNMVNQKYIALRNLKLSYILKNPLTIYEVKTQKLDNLINDCTRNMSSLLENKQNILTKLSDSYILNNPLKLIDKSRTNYQILLRTLSALNPLGILEKGYSVIKKDDKIINDKNCLKIDEIINIRLSKGEVNALVKEIK